MRGALIYDKRYLNLKCNFVKSNIVNPTIINPIPYLCPLNKEMLAKEVQVAVEKGTMLPLMEEFYTIQGEGFHTGTAAYFIRIGGCDVGCHWCDVKESWNAELHPPTAIEQIVANAKQYADTVVITGGEPLTWDMTALTQKLKEQKLKVHNFT